MDDEDDSTRVEEHYKSKSTWLRLVFMFVFYILGSLAALVASVVVVLGFLWVLFTGETNKQLQQVGKGIAAYVHEIICYLTYNSDTKPFPFDAEWPSAS
jgi:amino acid permease